MDEINLYDLLRYYKKHWVKVVAAALIGLLLALSYTTLIQKPRYTSTATLIAVGAASSTSGQASVQLNNYTQLFTSRRVLEPVLQELHSNLTYQNLAQDVKATNDTNTELISLSVSDKNARNSQLLANGIIASFRNEVSTIYGKDNVSLIDGASLPTTPSNVKLTTQLGLGFLGGLLISVLGLFFAFDFSQSKTANLSASERLLYEKTRSAEKAKAQALKLEQQAVKSAIKREKKNARAEHLAVFLKRWAEARAARTVARAEKRSEILENRVKRTALKVEARKAKEAARQAVKEARIAASNERQAERAKLKAEKMKVEAAEKAIRLRAEERRRKDDERRKAETAAAQKTEEIAQEQARKAAEKAEAERKKAEEHQAKEEANAKAKAKEAAAKAEADRKQAEEQAMKKAEEDAMAIQKAADIEANAQERILKLKKFPAKKSTQRPKKNHATSLHGLNNPANLK